MNDWKIVVDHAVNYIGNLYSQDGSSPFVTEMGQQLSTTQVSNLIDKIAPDAETVADIAEETINAAEIPTAKENAFEVWEELKEDHNTVGTFGQMFLTIKTAIGLLRKS